MTTPINGIYVLQNVVPADIAAAPVGVKAVEIYDDNGVLFSPSQVAQMESGGGLTVGYFSIGEAENYRDYFSTLPSSVLGPQDPSFPGDYQVAYWSPEWWKVSTDYVDTIMAQGYQGVFLDVVDECDTTWAKNHAPGGDAKGAMINLITNLAAYAHQKNPDFKIWANISGSEELAGIPAFRNTIDGAYEEELFYSGGAKNTTADINWNVGYLKQLVAAGKPVVDVEYLKDAATTKIANVKTWDAQDGFGYYIAKPNLELSGVDTIGWSGTASAFTFADVAPSPTMTTAAAAPTAEAMPSAGLMEQMIQAAQLDLNHQGG